MPAQHLPSFPAGIPALVAWANQHAVSLVPVSSAGGPRRRGDTAPTRSAVVEW